MYLLSLNFLFIFYLHLGLHHWLRSGDQIYKSFFKSTCTFVTGFWSIHWFHHTKKDRHLLHLSAGYGMYGKYAFFWHSLSNMLNIYTMWTSFFFFSFFFIQIIFIIINLLKIQTDSHSGTMVCRKTNIWYIPHNMYLVNQSNVYLTMQRKHKLK
jgi:hypothetical protein